MPAEPAPAAPAAPTRLEQAAAFIGATARPLAVIATSFGAAISSVMIAAKVDDFANAALFIGAVFAGAGALYGAKAWETSFVAKQQASVEIARAAAPPPPAP